MRRQRQEEWIIRNHDDEHLHHDHSSDPSDADEDDDSVIPVHHRFIDDSIDDDDDDESVVSVLLRSRRSSFGDAEDLLNTVGYYESFNLQSPSPMKAAHHHGPSVPIGADMALPNHIHTGNNGNLHYRTTRQTTHPLSFPQIQTQTQTPNNNHGVNIVTPLSTPGGHLHGRSPVPTSAFEFTPQHPYMVDDETPRHRLQRQLPTLTSHNINVNNRRHQILSSFCFNNIKRGEVMMRHHNHRTAAHGYPNQIHPSSSPIWHSSTWRRSWTLIRWCFFVSLVSYMILLLKSTYWLGQTQTSVEIEESVFDNGPLGIQHHQHSYGDSDSYVGLHGSTGITGTTGLYGSTYYNQLHPYDQLWYNKRVKLAKEAQVERELRGTERRERSRPQQQLRSLMTLDGNSGTTANSSDNRPVVASSSSFTSLDWYRFQPLEEGRSYPDTIGVASPVAENAAASSSSSSAGAAASSATKTAATLDQLCGFPAQTASLSHPQYYPPEAALNDKSRVLITGILNPVGFALALHLNEHCGVQMIAGIDSMYPNTVYNRLLMQERVQLLVTKIPKLVKPLLLPFIGLDPKMKSSEGDSSSSTTSPPPPQSTSSSTTTEDEINHMHGFEPTHIVHLASYSYDVYNTALVDPLWKNRQSPYVPNVVGVAAGAGGINNNAMDEMREPLFYPLKSSMVSMEQLLTSIASVPSGRRPQLIYATTTTTTTTTNSSSSTTAAFRTMKQVDELLVDTFHAHDTNRNPVPSIGLRLPGTIYGPWGLAGTVMHDMLENAVEQWNYTVDDNNNNSPTTRATTITGDIIPNSLSTTSTAAAAAASTVMDLLYVDDAVEAIVAAMQYRADVPIVVSVPPETTTSVTSVASVIRSSLVDSNIVVEDVQNGQPGTAPEEGAVAVPQQTNMAPALTLPEQRTSLRDGLVRSIAWHLDRLTPFGPPQVETGDDFLKRHGQATCSPNDMTCHKSYGYLPCSSECNIRDQCLPSIFDPIRELAHNVSEGCDIVMYTQSLGYNVEEMGLHAEFMDDKDLDDDDILVCNFAFIPRESDLVNRVTNKVPREQLAKFGIKPDPTDATSDAMRERKLDGLNGRLLYRGWVLIWVKDGNGPLSVNDKSLLKMSPSRFFHPGVRHGLFVEENFSVSPNLEDVLFLVAEMKRRRLPTRTLKREEKVPGTDLTKKVKYRIPDEPPRRAAILFAPLRYPNIDDPIVQQYQNGKKKLTIYDAAKFMRYEVGYEHGEKEPASLRRQREHYERIPSYINRNSELRSNSEPWYRYAMRHWVRTRWVVHDFKLEEARLLRCDWYQEHVQWGNDLDQLSFANVMAYRELKRRIAHREPDDHVPTFIEEHPELHDMVDSYEWHPMETEVNKLYKEPTNWVSQLPDNMHVVVDAAGNVQVADGDNNNNNNNINERDVPESEMPLYVRIMSERVMAASRKIWSKVRKQLVKAKTTGHHREGGHHHVDREGHKK